MSEARGEGTGAWAKLEIPVLVLAYLLCYWAPWEVRGARAWMGAASWGAAHGWGDLRASSFYVTAGVTCSAVLGAVLRVTAAWRGRRMLGQIGLFATSAPLCVLLSLGSAVVFLVTAGGVCGVAASAASRRISEAAETPGRALAGEAFAVLSAACFAGLSWQYNAQLLTRALLISAGAAMILRALAPAGRRLSGA